MYFRQFLNDESACASYLLGCKTHSKFAVVDPHVDLVDEYIALADAQGVPIVAVLDTHVQADHVSGLPELVRRTGATPGHAGAHHAYLVTDRTRGDDPWFVMTGDALLVADAGRPDLHARGGQSVDEMARLLYRSLTERLLSLPDHLLLYPSHYSGSVCGRGLSANPASTIGFERRNNPMLLLGSEEAFVEALLRDIPPAPPQAEAIVAANRSGR